MTALYSVYRSQRFADLVGQESTARTLKNALTSGRVAHAYLFTGIRGTGKTSTARILAKAVNCLQPVDGEPCNKCEACIAVTSGSATDLIEIDAASNRGVDEIRDLRDKARYLPAQLKRKVYIIDEAHQLTPEAFNALLKTLEEPPEHVLFILCTTEAHKLPSTIISRCQRFDFRRIGEADIGRRLAEIATSEGLATAGDGLELIAVMAHGSMRDAITMLDQMASAGVASIDADTVREQLGLVSAPELAALLSAAARGDSAQVLRDVERLAHGGADLRQLANGLAEMARKAVLISLGAADAADLGLDAASAQELAAAVDAAGKEFAARAFESSLVASTEMKQTHDPKLLLELLLLRLAARPESAALPSLPAVSDDGGPSPSRGRAGSGKAPDAVAAAAEAAAPAAEAPGAEPTAEVDSATASAAADAAAPSPAPVAVAPKPADGLAGVTGQWSVLLDTLKGTGPGVRVRALLREAVPLDLDDDVLTIGFPYAIFSEKAQEPLNRQELEAALHQVFNRTFRLAFKTVGADELGAGPAAPPAPTGDAAVAPEGAGDGESAVNSAVKILGAKITDVRPRQRGPAGT